MPLQPRPCPRSGAHRGAWSSLLLAAAPVALAAEVSTYTEGPGFAPWSFETLDRSLTTGVANDQALEFVLPVDGDLPATSWATTTRLDLGKPGVDKEYLSLAWGATVPRGANVFVSYSVDGGAWLPAVGDLGFAIPDGTHGKTFAYRVTLTTSDALATPAVEFVTVESAKWTGEPTKPPSGDGDGSSHQPGASRKPGSGSYTYPPTGGSTAVPGSTSGGSYGGWTGVSGGGSGGIGSGTAPVRAAGRARAAATPARPTAQEPAVETTASASAPVPSPPPSTPTGPSQGVSGLPVDPGAPVVTRHPVQGGRRGWRGRQRSGSGRSLGRLRLPGAAGGGCGRSLGARAPRARHGDGGRPAPHHRPRLRARAPARAVRDAQALTTARPGEATPTSHAGSASVRPGRQSPVVRSSRAATTMVATPSRSSMRPVAVRSCPS